MEQPITIDKKALLQSVDAAVAECALELGRIAEQIARLERELAAERAGSQVMVPIYEYKWSRFWFPRRVGEKSIPAPPNGLSIASIQQSIRYQERERDDSWQRYDGEIAPSRRSALLCELKARLIAQPGGAPVPAYKEEVAALGRYTPVAIAE